MTIRLSRVPGRLLAATFVASLSLVLVGKAWGSDAERKAMIAKVNPSVVQVKQEHSLGSGFVVYVDGDDAIDAILVCAVDAQLPVLAQRRPLHVGELDDTPLACGRFPAERAIADVRSQIEQGVSQ